MQGNGWLFLAVAGLGLIALIGFFFTKTPGFGKFTTSTLLLILVLAVSTDLYVAAGWRARFLAICCLR
jgi:hypothetical protein